jgi:hypothetical protein
MEKVDEHEEKVEEFLLTAAEAERAATKCLDKLKLDVTLDRAKVPQDLRPLFKEAFSNVNHAFTKNADEREVILANAARAVIGSMPPTEQAPLKVLDTLLAFLNELRASYAPKAAQSSA